MEQTAPHRWRFCAGCGAIIFWWAAARAEGQSRLTDLVWTFQRVGWVAMLLVVIAALAGLFGTGPLDRGISRAVASESGIRDSSE
jgi:hypothetical protein